MSLRAFDISLEVLAVVEVEVVAVELEEVPLEVFVEPFEDDSNDDLFGSGDQIPSGADT